MAMRRRFMSASGIPDNQIWYTTNDGNIIEPMLKPNMGAITAEFGFGSILESNRYYDKGIIKTYGAITQIGMYAFHEASSLISIILPRQVSTIVDSAFSGCTSLSQIDLSNVSTIGHSAFSGCTSLSQIDLSKVVTIGSLAFQQCISLQSIKLSKALEYIPESCFEHCASLEEVTIDENVKEIGALAFSSCAYLKRVYVKATTPPIILTESRMPFYKSPISKVFVPSDSVTAYKNAFYWRTFTIEGYNFD